MHPFGAPFVLPIQSQTVEKKAKNRINNSCCGFLPLIQYLFRLKTRYGFVLREHVKRVPRPTDSGHGTVPFNDDGGAIFFLLCMRGRGIEANPFVLQR